ASRRRYWPLRSRPWRGQTETAGSTPTPRTKDEGPGTDQEQRPQDHGPASAHDRALGGRRGRHVVEDALAAVALHDRVVLANQLEDLRAQAHVAYRAEAIPRRRGHGDALADPRHLLECGDQTLVDLLQQRGA